MRKNYHRLKYITSHCAGYALTMAATISKRTGLGCYLQLFSYLSNLILLISLGLGLYIRWTISQDVAVLLFAFFGLFLFMVACALVYYFSLDMIGFSLSRLWIGCLLGLIAFTYQNVEAYRWWEDLMNWLLVTSLALRLFWNIIDRQLCILDHNTAMISSLDCMEMLGMAIAAIFLGRDFVAIMLMVVAFAFSIVTIRLKSYVSLLNFASLITIVSTVYCSKLLKISVNPYALMCFVGRLAFEPILDLYFCHLTTLERWRPFLGISRSAHRFLLLVLITVQLSFYAIVTKQMPHHKEWFIVVPIYAAFSIIWLSYHVIFVITCWQLATKMKDCNITYLSLDEETRNINRIMAAKGLRHFGLISRRLMIVTVASTVILAGVSWETKSALSVSLYFLVIPIELSVNSLLYELGSALGGTCIGYAVLAPAAFHKPVVGQATLLPTTAMQELATRATHILNTVQRFFAFHLINNYGCDYSSSGLSLDSVRTKLMALFQQCTEDGPRYDTYLVYYSGHVHDNGDWALAGDGVLSFDTLSEWWQQQTAGSDSRLILVLDTLHSSQWLRSVRTFTDGYIALQTCRLVPASDPELPKPKIGDFSTDWTEYNSGDSGSLDWHAKSRTVLAAYSVSHNWTDFQFHLPTDEESQQHWDASFPRHMKPLISLANFSCVGNFGAIFCCCDGIVRCLKRKRMMWMPPAEYNSGHGFKLVRS